MCAGEKKVPKISVCCVIHLTPEIGNKLVGRGLYRTHKVLFFESHAQFYSTTILYKAFIRMTKHIGSFPAAGRN